MPGETRGEQAVATSPLLPLDNSWLKETTEKLRVRQTAWEGYQHANLISHEELQRLRDAEQAGRTGNLEPVLAKCEEYAALYTRLLGKLSRADTIQQVVLLADDLVQAAPDRLDAFLAEQQLYPTLLKLLDVQEPFVSLKAAQLLAVFLGAQATARGPAPPAEAVEKLLAYLNTLLEQAVNDAPDGAQGQSPTLALMILGELLRYAPFRARVWQQAVEQHAAQQAAQTLVARLVALIRAKAGLPASQPARDSSAGNPQLQYHGLFALWVLTFDPSAATGVDRYFAVSPVLVRSAQTALKHKIVRLVVGIWDNMLSASEEESASRLLGAKVLPLCKTLQERNYPDEEMRVQLSHVTSVLSNRLDQMSSYDEFVSELQSQQLSFDNPAHTLDEFWKEHAEKLVEHGERDLKLLVSLVQPGTRADASTLAVACNDLGKFVHFYDGGRRRVTSLGAKNAIMALVDHEDPNVQHAALHTLARLVSSSWK